MLLSSVKLSKPSLALLEKRAQDISLSHNNSLVVDEFKGYSFLTNFDSFLINYWAVNKS